MHGIHGTRKKASLQSDFRLMLSFLNGLYDTLLPSTSPIEVDQALEHEDVAEPKRNEEGHSRSNIEEIKFAERADVSPIRTGLCSSSGDRAGT